MRPDDLQPSRSVGRPQSQPPARGPAPAAYTRSQQDAAANVVRNQIDSIFSGEDPGPIETAPAIDPTQQNQGQPQPQQTSQPQPQQSTTSYQQPLAATNPYERTHDRQASASIQPEQWKAYHSAWQDYYKRYYEGYYTQQLNSAKASFVKDQPKATVPTEAIGSSATAAQDEPKPKVGPLTRKEAMDELRTKLLKKVEKSAKSARTSRHFAPIIATLSVLLIFVFLQYNTLLIANVKAYVTPGNIDPQNIIVDPTSRIEVDPEPRLIIPKINVDTPVFYDIPIDEASQNKAMENGIAHFPIPGANSHPGEIGNTVLSGHSSNDVFAAGDYKFIFMQLDKLDIGDTIYAHYEGVRYTYVVTQKKEVAPTNVQALIYDTDKPEMTLITCTPLGTALRRLLITAEQVYPTTTKPAPEQSSDSVPSGASIPGQGQPSVLQRLFN